MCINVCEKVFHRAARHFSHACDGISSAMSRALRTDMHWLRTACIQHGISKVYYKCTMEKPAERVNL